MKLGLEETKLFTKEWQCWVGVVIIVLLGILAG